MKWKLLVIPLMLLLMVSMNCVQVTADIILDDNFVIHVGNENFTFPASGITFDQIRINESGSWVQFNQVGINITSGNSINVSLSYLNPNVATAAGGDSIVTFNADTSGGRVWMNLSGMRNSLPYTVKLDGVVTYVVMSNATGVISFNHSSWSDHDVDIVFGDQSDTRRITIAYQHDLLGNTYTKGTSVIEMFGIIMVFIAIGIGITLLLLVKGGKK